MWNRVVQIDEERARVFALDERARLRREEVVRVVIRDVRSDARPVSEEMVRELPVRVTMIQESKRVLEALAVGLTGRSRSAKAPLANHRRPIACILQRRGHGHVLVAQRDLTVAANPCVAAVLAGHEGRARGCAHGAARVVVRETDASRGHPVKLWCLKSRLACTRSDRRTRDRRPESAECWAASAWPARPDCDQARQP